MKRNTKRLVCAVLLLSTLFSLFACAGNAPQTTATQDLLNPNDALTQTQTSSDTTDAVPPVPETSKYLNPLTGLECDVDHAGKRPIGIMIGNTKDALPQYGLSKMDIIYEVLAEGGILRLEGFVLDYQSIEKIGSIRSARAYYAELASAHDAIFVHSGINIYATPHVKKLGVNNINATGDAFFRDPAREGYSREHTHFVWGAKLDSTIAQFKYRTELSDPNFTSFPFDSNFTTLGTGKAATYVKVKHSGYNVSEFRYNATDKKYYHSQYGADHIDGANKEKVATENVFVLFAAHGYFADGKSRNITLTGQGKGYYMTCGEMIPIVWKRAGENGTFSYFKEDGTPLSVRPGKSYVSIADTKIASTITIS